MLKKALLGSAMLLAATLGHAQDANAPIPPASSLSPFVGLGLTFGGDQIGKDIQYSNGNSSKLHAGGLVDLRVGAEYRVSGSPLSFQLSAGYHVDTSLAADNGSASFKRFPIELLAHWAINDSWRIGGGVRKALSAEAKSSGLGTGYVANEKFNSSTGVVLEVETFALSPKVGIKIRGVSEKYKSQDVPGRELDGSNIGVIGVYYFR